MSSATVTEVTAPPRTARAIPFRVVAVLLAATYLVLFGSVQLLLTPWVVLPDVVDHGWTRTPELHRWADSAAAATMAALGAGALLAVWRPLTRSGLVAWVGVLLAVVGLGSGVSVLLQQHTGAAGALLQGVLTAALTAVPFVLLHPQRREVLAGGRRDAGPAGAARAVLLAVSVAGVALVVGALVWRLTGGVVENPLEDDVLSFVLLGVTLATGGAWAASGREGWRVVAWVTGAVAAYAVVAGASLLLL